MYRRTFIGFGDFILPVSGLVFSVLGSSIRKVFYLSLADYVLARNGTRRSRSTTEDSVFSVIQESPHGKLYE
jgi:hypothetical protein